MFRLGAHVSISGGVQKAVERELAVGGNAGQIFVGSPRGWAVSEFDPEEVEAFRTRSETEDVGPWIVHGTYLVNLATPKEDLAAKSLDTVQAELDAAAELEIPYYVFHPGSHTGAGRETAVENVGDRLSTLDIPDSVTLLLENTAGQGTSMGKTFGELDAMVEQSTYGYDRLGVCLDTCHLYAAGYDFTTDDEMTALVTELDGEIGLENVHYLHLNDSKHPLGAAKDEHEHIGEGEIGTAGFERFVNHEALRDTPMVLETPADDERGFAWNVDAVRSLRQGD
jgi:deoxyribonuclease-4